MKAHQDADKQKQLQMVMEQMQQQMAMMPPPPPGQGGGAPPKKPPQGNAGVQLNGDQNVPTVN